MVATKCRSGRHTYESFETEALQKCCNGYVPVFAPRPAYAHNGGYDRWGNWHGILVFVPETDTAEIERLKSLGPMEDRASTSGPWLVVHH